jgi:hypothetical protein
LQTTQANPAVLDIGQEADSKDLVLNPYFAGGGFVIGGSADRIRSSAALLFSRLMRFSDRGGQS